MARTLILLFFLTNVAFSNGGSNYSRFGIGDINYTNGAGFNGMGGVSAAMPDDKLINLRNPALWSKIQNTRVQFGYTFNQAFADIPSGFNYQTNGSLDGFLMSFVLDTSLGLSMGTGLFKNTNVAVEVSSAFNTIVDNRRSSGVLLQSSEGGLNTAYLGGSVDILDNLSFGAMITYHFGSIDNEFITIFNEESSFSSVFLQEDAIFGTNFRAGLYYEPIKNLSIGTFYESQSNLSIESRRVRRTGFEINDTNTVESETNLPQLFGFGASYKLNRWRLGADYWIQDFSNFNYNTNRDNLTGYNSSNGILLGLQREGNRKVGSAFLDKNTYRIGAGLNNLYYTLMNTQISEMFLSLGFSSNLGETSALDYSIMFGVRGQDSGDIFQEYFFRMGFNVSIGETWFVPFMKEYDEIED